MDGGKRRYEELVKWVDGECVGKTRWAGGCQIHKKTMTCGENECPSASNAETIVS